MEPGEILDVEGRRLRLKNLDKVLYPKAGFTKAQVIDYYLRVAPVLLPHIRGRPLTLKRYPDGVEAPFFYEKRCPSYRPSWVKTAPIHSASNGGDVPYCVVEDVATLVWLANLADLEIHVPLALARAYQRPTMMVFDLDPGAPADLVECCEVGLMIRDIFEDLSLQCFPKSSGSKGLQVYVPLNTAVTYQETKSFARAVAEHLEAKHPNLVVSNMKKSLRTGKILVDWSQNDPHKTTVAVYSLRARERPTVSTPVTWDEVERTARKRIPAVITFETHRLLARLDRVGDLFEPVLRLKQKLPRK